ncbi:50S ribosomal protein L18 [Candidatus Woesearchaeota archaeon]|nr:50S ribosomal protein L18 [Candidatus Woesearchaeota archaeon]
MATKRRFTVFFRRKREGRTNYKKRLTLLLSRKPRVAIRPSNKNMIVQVISYHENGDKIEASAHSNELKKHGWNFSTGNLPAAYLTGFLAGVKAKKAGIKNAVVDIGLNESVKHSRIYAAIKGLVDAGIDAPHAKEMFPDDKRINGSHIADYASKAAGANQFSKLRKDNADFNNITKSFDDVKKKVEKA